MVPAACVCCLAQAMAFGKPKKLGMKPPKKAKVPKAETAAAEVSSMEAVPPAEKQPRLRKTVSHETPPSSPVRARVPPSPGKLKVNASAAWARDRRMSAAVYARFVRRGESKYELAVRIYEAKMNKISALGARKNNPITPRQELNRLWKAQNEWWTALNLLNTKKLLHADAVVEAKDALIELLEKKLRRALSQKRRGKGKRGGVFGSPSAHFKFGFIK